MKFLFLCTFSGLLSFEACSLNGLTVSLPCSPPAEIATRCIRKQQSGCVPELPSSPGLPSSAALGWEAWLMCWTTRQSSCTRTSLTSHRARVSTTQAISTPPTSSLTQGSLSSANQSHTGEMCVHSKKTKNNIAEKYVFIYLISSSCFCSAWPCCKAKIINKQITLKSKSLRPVTDMTLC